MVGTACGDRSPVIHNANICDMDAKMADVVTEEEAVEHLKQAGRRRIYKCRCASTGAPPKCSYSISYSPLGIFS